MSIGAGAVALRRFQVLESTKKTPIDWLVGKMRPFLISPIGMDEEREKAIGWCHPFTGEPELGDLQSLIYGDALVFGMRSDSKRIPGTLFRLQMKAALDAVGRGDDSNESKQAKRFSKKLREATRDRIKAELLRRTLPSIRLTEVIWHLDSNEVWLTSSSSGVVGEFESLFFESFGVSLVHLNPGTSAFDYERILEGGAKISIEKYLDVVPARFVSSLDKQSRPLEVPAAVTTHEDLF